jgi:erythromycin esterase-like protein
VSLRHAHTHTTYAQGFYGIDVYSMHSSAKSVVGFLEGVDPDMAKKAKSRYHCLDRWALRA